VRFLKQALGMWLILLVVMFTNGIVRVRVLQPRLGEDTARQVATVTGIALVLALSFLFVRRLDSPTSRELLQIGILWLVLTVAFEFGMGIVSGASWQTMLADYDLRRGRLWPIALVVILLAPWLWGKAGVSSRRAAER
jgi:hypothetical protein